ncbi:MAG: hypothetical protein M1827_007250 [Pycnora praestabilis]|nr:MAG: hypothetical protein M1827_007250 [Pycnora praestabilis]
MLHHVNLRFQPSAFNGLTWSKDGELAIAAGEHVEILVPNTSISKNLRNPANPPTKDPWTSVRFRTNTFTDDEIPLLQPASSDVLSIGEEQSTCTVTALAWSPPGLARFRRAALAVLTTNHSLSIWECTTNPKNSGNWNRVLVVNREVDKYFEELDSQGLDDNAQKRDLKRLRSRIRAFTWSQTCDIGASQEGTARDIWGVPLLVTTNDNYEVVFIRILRPYGIFSPRAHGWRAEVIGHFQAQGLSDEIQTSSSPSLLATILNQCRYVSCVAWSPWIALPGGGCVAILAYLICAKIRFKMVYFSSTRAEIAQFNNSNFTVEDLYVDTSAIKNRWTTGPLLWYDKVHNGQVFLAIGAGGEVSVLSIQIQGIKDDIVDAKGIRCAIIHPPICSHLLVAQDELGFMSQLLPLQVWDSISSMVFLLDQQNDIIIQVVTQLSHTSVFKYKNQKLLGTRHPASLEICDLPQWHRHLIESRTQFSLKYDTGGLVVSKIWGLAASPFGSQVAVCFSSHPGDMVEYSTASTEKSTIVFDLQRLDSKTWLESLESDPTLANSNMFSAEAFILELRYSREGMLSEHMKLGDVGKPSTEGKDVSTLRRMLVKLALGESNGKIHTDEPSIDVEPHATKQEPLAMISRKILDNPQEIAGRLIRLMDAVAMNDGLYTVMRTESSAEPDRHCRLKTVCLLVDSVLQITHGRTQGDRLSRKIKYAAACFGILHLPCTLGRGSLLQGTFESLAAETSIDLSPEIKLCVARRELESELSILKTTSIRANKQVLPPRRSEEIASPGAQSIFEVCEICGTGIGWDDALEARCATGHVFVRCGVTFLAIQAPGISKYCGICGRQFLHEKILPDIDEHKPTISQRVDSTDDKVVLEQGHSSPGTTTETAVDDTDEFVMVGQDNSSRSRGETPSLAQIVFASCDLCIYCGGKFVS